MPTAPRDAVRTNRREPGRHVDAGVPRDFREMLARAPALAAALTLAVAALCIAILVMPIDEELPATLQAAPWAVAVLAFAVAIFAISYGCMKRDED